MLAVVPTGFLQFRFRRRAASRSPNHAAGRPANGGAMTISATPRKTPAKAAIASWAGTTLEYYDFAVYGTASALVLNELFFPEELPAGIRVLLSMATLAVGYVVRPLGAFVLGPIGDRYGRKAVMMLTLFGIGIC